MNATGTVLQQNCDVNVNYNAGCGVGNRTSGASGSRLNSAGGGVIAMQWDLTGINVWQFSRAAIPTDLKAQKPTPATWGKPVARFDASTCDIGRFFTVRSLSFELF